MNSSRCCPSQARSWSRGRPWVPDRQALCGIFSSCCSQGPWTCMGRERLGRCGLCGGHRNNGGSSPNVDPPATSGDRQRWSSSPRFFGGSSTTFATDPSAGAGPGLSTGAGPSTRTGPGAGLSAGPQAQRRTECRSPASAPAQYRPGPASEPGPVPAPDRAPEPDRVSASGPAPAQCPPRPAPKPGSVPSQVQCQPQRRPHPAPVPGSVPDRAQYRSRAQSRRWAERPPRNPHRTGDRTRTGDGTRTGDWTRIGYGSRTGYGTRTGYPYPPVRSAREGAVAGTGAEPAPWPGAIRCDPGGSA